MERDYDVIVIGGGGAGLAAATTAADHGASVLLVEAGERLGGSTALSGGVFYAAGTSVQRAKGIEGDTPDAVYRYYMTVNQYKLEAALVRRLCDEAPAALEWLIGLGVRFPVENLYVSGVDGVPRGHRAEGHGAEIAYVLEQSTAGKRIEVALATRVQNLLRTSEGAVGGILVDGQEVRAGAVVIATGGFGNNPRLLAELYPDAARQGDLAWYIGSPHSRGDGLEMAQGLGADLSPANRGLLLLTPGFAKELEPYLPGWLVHINRQGRRFVDEAIEYSVLAAVVREQIAGECFGIFDDATRETARTSAYRTAPNWVSERLDQLIRQGKVQKADTLDGLAQTVGIHPGALAATLERYNADCAAGRDRSFFKIPEMLQPVARPPFYAVRIRPAVVCWTGTGLRIDTEAQVLSRGERPIPGLYAAGETTGGMFGECYAGGGASIANAIVFGRIAGRNAAELAGRAV